jgi:arginyl-tRNA synthetase
MNYALDQFTAEVNAAIAATGRIPSGMVELQTPKPNVPADLSFPAFRAAKQLGVKPPDLAQQLADTIQLPADSLIGEVVAMGPYLNFRMHAERFTIRVLQNILHAPDSYGYANDGNGKTVVVDYSSPNVAKRMHVGHIRSTIIGQALVNIYRALGYHVIGDNHLGDWGKQFGVIIAAMMREGKPAVEGEEALEHLEAMYSRYNEDMQQQPELDNEARRWSLSLEQGDTHARELWQWCVETTLQANQHNYDRLGVSFDHVYGESYYEDMLHEMIAQALATGAARRDEDGSVVVDQLGDKLPPFLLQRNDGGTLYITRDVATIAFRMREFQPDRILYVVGTPQELHFRQLFALVKAMGYAQETELVHVGFGSIFDESGQALSTRRGNMIYLDALLNDAITRAMGIIEQKQTNLPDEEKQAVAEAVGIGAVIYNDLYQPPQRNITLDWGRMLATEGNSATYLQYSYARCQSILRRAGEDGYQTPTETIPAELAILLTHPSEQQLVKHLARLPEIVREAAERYAPFVIAEWCYTTAREFGVFFEQCSVLKADTPDLRTARLALVAATAYTLKNGLNLLGIKAPERM